MTADQVTTILVSLISQLPESVSSRIGVGMMVAAQTQWIWTPAVVGLLALLLMGIVALKVRT